MDWTSLLLFLHILSFVFWLGTDVGVFILGKFAQNKEYGTQSRLLLLKVAMILDMFPRVALVISIFTGYQLAVNYEVLIVPGLMTPIVWLFSGIWLAVVVGGLALQNISAGAIAKKIEKICLCIALAALVYLVIEFFITGEMIQTIWLCGKVMLFAAIILAMFLLEPAFIPAVIAFQRLETEGSSIEIESIIKSSMDKTYIWVIAIYVAVVISAILGVWKFT
ncbi:MAG: hypothetical protein ACI82S_003044 [Patiriisocius sp.]|jgi:hypothetical protein